MYPTAYLIGAGIFGVVWLGFFLVRPDLRREILTLSMLAGIMGPISEHFYLQDYWQPEYWFPASWRVEDFLAGFFLGGISAVGYEVIWRKKYQCACQLRTTWVLPLVAILGLGLLVWLFHGLGLNSIYASMIAFVAAAGFMLLFRPELVKPALGSGLVLAGVMFIFYLVYQQLYPGIIEQWWRLEALSGIRLWGVPMEELLWGFSWGLIGGSLYEFVAKVRLE